MSIENLEIHDDENGLRIGVIAHPGANSNTIKGIHNGMLKIDITAPPEKGKANDAIIKLLAKKLGIAKSSIEIVSGETSRKKIILLRGIDRESLISIVTSIIKYD